MDCVLLVIFFTFIKIMLVYSIAYVKKDLFLTADEKKSLINKCYILHYSSIIIIFGQIIRLGYR